MLALLSALLSLLLAVLLTLLPLLLTFLLAVLPAVLSLLAPILPVLLLTVPTPVVLTSRSVAFSASSSTALTTLAVVASISPAHSCLLGS